MASFFFSGFVELRSSFSSFSSVRLLEEPRELDIIDRVSCEFALCFCFFSFLFLFVCFFGVFAISMRFLFLLVLYFIYVSRDFLESFKINTLSLDTNA
jgi:hypothetical protein